MTKRVSKRKVRYTEAVAELEQILERLRTGELGVDELTGAVSRAKELIEECRAQLMLTKAELDNIINTEE